MNTPTQPTRGQVVVGKIKDGLRTGLGFIGAFLGGLLRGYLRWKESTVVLPIVLIGFGLICFAVIYFTGRQLLTDMGDLVEFGKAAVKLAIIFAIVGGAQQALFGYRTESGPGAHLNKPPLADDIHDSCVTFGLLIFVLLSVSRYL